MFLQRARGCENEGRVDEGHYCQGCKQPENLWVFEVDDMLLGRVSFICV